MSQPKPYSTAKFEAAILRGLDSQIREDLIVMQAELGQVLSLMYEAWLGTQEEAVPMKTLILKVELRGERLDTDLDSPVIAGLTELLRAEVGPTSGRAWARDVEKVDVSFQFSEESID